jgi:hypothetical protein
MEFVLIVFVLIIIYIVFIKVRNNKIEKRIMETMMLHHSFSPDHYQIMVKRSSAIAIDINKRMICIVDNQFKPIILKKVVLINLKSLLTIILILPNPFFIPGAHIYYCEA